MDDFKSYYERQKSENKSFGGNTNSNNNNSQNGGNGKVNGNQKQTSGNNSAENTINLAANIAKAFSGKSEGQIYSTIIAQAEQGKRDGTLTNADLDNFYNAVAPLVDGFKRKKLAQIIARLKEI
jgi:hypothetical protein